MDDKITISMDDVNRADPVPGPSPSLPMPSETAPPSPSHIGPFVVIGIVVGLVFLGVIIGAVYLENARKDRALQEENARKERDAYERVAKQQQEQRQGELATAVLLWLIDRCSY